MKQQMNKTYTYFIAATLLIAGASSCKKEVSVNSNTDTAPITTSTSSTIAVATDGTSNSGSATDSVYVIHPCEKGIHRDSVAASSLSTAIQAYLATNYTGYTFKKAYAVKDTTGTVKGYVVIINFNGKPVGLAFNADGTFIKVLEQREKGDLTGEGWHRGGRFEHRDGQHRDTIALTALPTSVTAYMAAHYAGDTLLKAFKLESGNYLVLSKNNGPFATLFTSAGVFIAHVSICPLLGLLSVTEGTLPTAALSYLSTTYPNYVLNKVFSVSFAGTIKGYVAVINANNTRYCVAFDASGNFVGVKSIW
ncbi:MAG: PepSY-like domain-containing protein [Sediminibacterium sp.]